MSDALCSKDTLDQMIGTFSFVLYLYLPVAIFLQTK